MRGASKTYKDITKVLQKIKMTGSNQDVVSSGILKNIQVFGDQVDIDLVINNPALQARKRLEVDIMKIIHDEIYEKAKIKVNTKSLEPYSSVFSQDELMDSKTFLSSSII